ncbi:Uncharacterised protein [Streptococcus pneumoniae]|uniref:hypothetical protein n=1 Tax=Streptococcus pneumoniae TaxID=1313 RepID=UPI000B6D9F9F|nr:hypothetical protein [Streptococcus pneumoniae]SNK02739.1 Uncharacterised protein [Streptococcus pneumoniae]
MKLDEVSNPILGSEPQAVLERMAKLTNSVTIHTARQLTRFEEIFEEYKILTF